MSENATSAYEEAMEEIERARERLLGLKPQFDLLENIKAEFYPDSNNRFGRCRVRYYNERKPCIHVRVTDFQEIVPILRRIRTAGYKMDHQYDVDANGWKVWHFVGIKVIAEVGREEGARCRIEQVGVEETPVYKIVCDEEIGDLAEVAA